MVIDIDSMPNESEQLNKEIVLAHKNCHGGALHGFAGNGGVIPLDDRFSIRFDLLGNNFVNVKLVAHNKGDAPKQKYYRTKVQKVVVEKEIEKKPEVEQKSLVNKTKSVWNQ